MFGQVTPMAEKIPVQLSRNTPLINFVNPAADSESQIEEVLISMILIA